VRGSGDKEISLGKVRVEEGSPELGLPTVIVIQRSEVGCKCGRISIGQ